MKKISLSLLSIILSMLLLLQTLPLAVYAFEYRLENESEAEIEVPSEPPVLDRADEPAEEPSEATVLYEVEERREADKKVFRMSDGTFREAIYSDNVHYESEGKFFDIDNTLSSDKDGGEEVLANKENAAKVRFFKKSSSGKFYSLQNEGHKVTVSIEGAKKTDAVFENSSKSSDNPLVLTGQSSRVHYKEIFPNVDLEFTLISTQVKENIVIREKDALDSITYTYSFNGGIRAVQEDSRTISVYEKNSENVIFTITAPALWDSAGDYSEELSLAIVEEKNSRLTVRLDFFIGEEMAFPVTIDPIMHFQADRQNIQDTHIISAYPTTNYDKNNHIRIRNNGYALLQFPTPNLNPGEKIVHAEVALFPYGYFDSSLDIYSNANSYNPPLQLTAHKILRGWNETTVTYQSADADNGFFDPTVQAFHEVGSNSDFYTWDITRLANEWTEGFSENYGILLKYSSPPSDGSMFDTFFCSTNGAYLQQEVWPQAVYSYVNTAGLESYFSYHTQSLGFAGEGHVNTLTGNLTVTRELVTTGGNVAPISLSLIYNTADALYIGSPPYGVGWKLNLAQKCEKFDPENQTPYIRYTDADGTRHYFYQENGVWIDEIDPDRKIYYNAEARTLEMRDSSGTSAFFIQDGWLEKWHLCRIVDIYGNTITLDLHASNMNRVNRVTSSNGACVNLFYNEYDYLTSLSYMDEGVEKTIIVSYNSRDAANNAITDITFPDGSCAQYDYHSGTFWLRFARDLSGAQIGYTYNIKTGRISTTSEIASDGTVGNTFSFSYQPTATTVHDENLNRTYLYTFAQNGTLKSVVDTTPGEGNGYGQYYEWGGGDTSTTGMDNLTFASKNQKSTVNLLPNHSFEGGVEPAPTGSSLSSGGVTTEKSRTGARSYRVSNPDTSSESSSVAQYAVSLVAGTKYTFSAYVNTSQMTSAGDSCGAYLYVQNSSSHWQSEFVGEAADSWQRITLNFTPSASDSYLVVFGMKGATGSAYFDNVQLEVGDLSEYNLLENAGLENDSVWDRFPDTIYSPEDKISGSNAGKISCGTNPNNLYHFCQYLYVPNGKAGDTYVASAFAKATAAASEGWRFTLLVRFLNGGATVNDQNLYFNAHTTEWQKISGAVKAAGDYDGIYFFLLYYNNCNTAYFDNAQLLLDNFGNTYTYDSKGNLISTVDLQGKEENTFFYDGNNQLVRQSDISGGEILYSYNRDKTTQLEQATAGGNTTAFTYDSFGNALTSETFGSELIPGEYYYLQNLQTSEYLDTNNAENSADGKIGIEPFAKSSAQRWKLVDNGDGTYSFEPECASGKYLTGGNYWDYGAIRLLPAGSSEHQKISLEKVHSNLYVLKFASSPSFSVDGNESDCYTYSTNSTRCQKFAFIPVNTKSEEFPSITSSATYSQNGAYMTSITDSRGNSVEYEYNADRGYLKSETDPNGTTTSYTYTAGESLASVSVDGSTVSYGYNSAKQLSSITTPNGSVYGITYDVFGRKTSVSVGGSALASYTYNAIGATESVTYGNGTVTRYTYDALGRQVETLVNDIPQTRIVYDGSSRIHEQYDLVGNRKVKFEYDLLGREVKRELYDTASGKLLSSTTTRYDDTKNRIAGYEVKAGGKTTSYNYLYGENKAAPDVVTGVKVDGTEKIENEYDSLNRLSTRTVNSTTPIETDFTYAAGNRYLPAEFSTEDVIETLSGDFDSDGREDIAFFCKATDNSICIKVLPGIYQGFGSIQIWNETADYDPLAVTGRVVAGDFDGDGKDDIAALYDYGELVCKMHVFRSTGSAFAPYEIWRTMNSYNAANLTNRMVAGDFNGDGKDDIAGFCYYSSLVKTGIHPFLSTGTRFNLAPSYSYKFDQYNANAVTNRVVSGDFTGDGKDDLIALYYYNGVRTAAHLFPSQNGEFTTWSTHSESFDQYNSTLLLDGVKAGDFDSDGDTDLLGIYNDNGVAKVHFFAYSESGFASPQEVNWLQAGLSSSQIKGVVKCGSGLAFLSSQGEGSAKVLSASAEASGSTLWDSACGAGSSEGLATTLVESMQTGDETLSYTYDAVGNITSVSKNGSVIESYLYDAKNQLIAIRRGGDLWEYTYDLNGNILSVTKNGVVEKAYTYGDANWKDKLTAFNGEAITYDAIGNPLQYRNGMAFTWVNGRKLGTITQNGVITTYTYDGDGNRIKKQSGSTTIDYIVVGGVIYGEIRTENGISTSIHYLFDENGTRFGFVVGGTDTYYYRFNLQGDVTGIFDASGLLVAEYTYDAWGKLLSVSGSNTTIANLNPIRYRGYYYDTESGFYYLQSRYYDPEVCRFISPDGYISTGQGVLGHNMYAYCGNNPVNYCDPCGYCMHRWYLLGLVDCAKCKQKKKNKKNIAKKFKNEDGSSSLYDNRRFKPDSTFHEQILVVTPNASASLKNPSAKTGGSFDLITGGWETENADVSLLDVGHAEANFKVEPNYVDVGALVSAWSPSVSVDFGLFSISYEVEVGAVGFGYQRNANSVQFGFSFLVGNSLQISWE